MMTKERNWLEKLGDVMPTTTKLNRKKISNRELDFMIAEAIWHKQLDALGCPAGDYIGKRLSDWCKIKGVDPFKKCKCVPPNLWQMKQKN